MQFIQSLIYDKIVKKILLTLFFAIFFLFLSGKALAADGISCTPPATCYSTSPGPGCPTNYTPGGSCIIGAGTQGAHGGICCTAPAGATAPSSQCPDPNAATCPAGYDQFWQCPFRLVVPAGQECCKWNGLFSYDYKPFSTCSEIHNQAYGPCGTSGTCDTAIGTVSTGNPSGLISIILSSLLSISGAIAIFLIIRSGYKLMFSQGNPEQVQVAREELTAAIVGLLFIVLSLILIQFIGLDVLRLPTFGA